jgi:addiction module HigA family antidote
MIMFDPSHPGIILKEYVKGYNFNLVELALDLGTTCEHLSALINGESSISPDIAVKLATTFTNTTPEFWIQLQNNFDLASVRKSGNSS